MAEVFDARDFSTWEQHAVAIDVHSGSAGEIFPQYLRALGVMSEWGTEVLRARDIQGDSPAAALVAARHQFVLPHQLGIILSSQPGDHAYNPTGSPTLAERKSGEFNQKAMLGNVGFSYILSRLVDSENVDVQPQKATLRFFYLKPSEKNLLRILRSLLQH